MKYIITGHRGLIGEFMKKRLEMSGFECVRQIDQREGFNVLDLEKIQLTTEEKPEIFFHLAAHCKINESISIPALSHRNNSDGIFAVLEFCRKNNIRKIVVASTSRVLSKERNPYVASKIYAEELTKSYHDCYDLQYIIIRPSTVYGPTYDETSRLINNFIVAALKGNDLKVYGDENKTLDFTFVDDFVDGVFLLLDKPSFWNDSYNISGGDEVKIMDLAKEIIRQTGSVSRIIFLPPEKAQPQKVSIDISKMKKAGYSPKIKIKEGINRMLQFYRQNPSAWQRYLDRGEKFYNGSKSD